MSMLRIAVDTNHREGVETGLECEAILRRGTIWPWVADIVETTIKDLPPE